MNSHDDRLNISSVAVSKKQIEVAFRHFFGIEPPEITSDADYEAAKVLYTVLKVSVPPQDLHSPAARYVVALTMKMTRWKTQKDQSSE